MTVTSRTDGVVGHPDRHDAEGGGADEWWREPASARLYDFESDLADLYDPTMPDCPDAASSARHAGPVDVSGTGATDLPDASSTDPPDAGRPAVYDAARHDAVDGVGHDVFDLAPPAVHDAGRHDVFDGAQPDLFDGAQPDLIDGARDVIYDVTLPARRHPAPGDGGVAVGGAPRARRRKVSAIPVRPPQKPSTAGSDDGRVAELEISALACPVIPPVPAVDADAAHVRLARPACSQAVSTSGRRVGSSHLPLHLRQRRARLSVFVVLAVTAGLTLLALLTARSPTVPAISSVPASPPVSASTSGRVGIDTAGLAPSIEPPPAPSELGTTVSPEAVTAAPAP